MMRKVVGFLLVISLFLTAVGCGKTPTWEEQYDLGVRYLSENNYEEAIIAFTAAIEINPKQAPAYVGRGDAYVRSAEADDTLRLAQIDYEQAIELDEMIIDAYLGLANVHITLEEYEEAEEVLNRGLEVTGDENLAELLEEVMVAELSGSMSEAQKVLLAVNEYDESGALSSRTDYEYSEKGLLVRSIDTYISGTFTTDYEYDEENRLIRVMLNEPIDEMYEYVYNEQGKLVSWSGAWDIGEYECIYDAEGRLIQEVSPYGPDAYNAEYHYDENGKCTGKTERRVSFEAESKYDYDSSGRLSRETSINNYGISYTEYSYDFSPFVLVTSHSEPYESARLVINDIMNHEIISIPLSNSELEVDQDSYVVGANGNSGRLEFIYGTLGTEDGAMDNAESAVVSFEREDHSLLNSDSSVAMEQYYDLPVVEGDTPAIANINRALEERYNEFMMDLSTEEDLASYAEINPEYEPNNFEVLVYMHI